MNCTGEDFHHSEQVALNATYFIKDQGHEQYIQSLILTNFIILNNPRKNKIKSYIESLKVFTRT